MLLPGQREDRWAQWGREINLGGIQIIGIFERRSRQEWILNVKVYYMMTFFLVTTDHLETRLWFRDDEDFKSGMNLVAVTAYSVGVRVLSFILMSNHVHFVLEGDEEKVLQFITEFKRAYSRYLSHKYGSRDTLRRNGTDVQGLPLDGESLERAIAYVQMNSVAANICTRPEAYPWGTGNTFFQVVAGKGRPLVATFRLLCHANSQHIVVRDRGDHFGREVGLEFILSAEAEETGFLIVPIRTEQYERNKLSKLDCAHFERTIIVHILLFSGSDRLGLHRKLPPERGDILNHQVHRLQGICQRGETDGYFLSQGEDSFFLIIDRALGEDLIPIFFREIGKHSPVSEEVSGALIVGCVFDQGSP